MSTSLSETTIADRKVYVWNNAFSAAMPMLTSSTTTGRVGNAPFAAQTTGVAWENAEYSCVIRVFVDGEKIIRTWDYSGNMGGCQTYSKRLNIK
jgi:hypothetical protein